MSDKLTSTRIQIDNINNELVHLLIKRFQLLEQVHKIKTQESLELFDGKRTKLMNQILQDKLQSAHLNPMQKESINKILNNLFSVSLEYLKSK
ncbi:MAG: hypothetical protein HOO06_15700 [Bdellovibrionaceae bacterium]|jgi:chorismate mutase|nr:hypothetical protein [Pseudobdellovibrionaceae bacterium]